MAGGVAPLVALSHEWGWFTYRHIYIKNDLEGNKVLKLHCKDKNNDLGVYELNYKDEFKFQFQSAFRPTLYFCGLTWDDKLHWFVVFDENRDHHFCLDLHWSIRKDQPCVFNCDHNLYD
ncbi:hypothetical protein Lal_00036265, partial [Lupinus albus]